MRIETKAIDGLETGNTMNALAARARILIRNTNITVVDAVERVCAGEDIGLCMAVLALIESDLFKN
jgi:hypothetical protein